MEQNLTKQTGQKQTPNKSRLWLVISISILIIAMGVSLGIYYFVNYNQRTNTVPQIPNSSLGEDTTSVRENEIPSFSYQEENTSDWKVYTNNYYLYQINVPKDWLIEEVDKNNDPIVRLSSPNKEIIISSRIDDVSIDGAISGTYGDVVAMTDTQVGDYRVPRGYQSYSAVGYKPAYSILVYTNGVARPLNIHLPSFRIAIKDDLKKNDPLVLRILKTFKNTGGLKSIEDLMEYSVPPGWTVPTSFRGGDIRSPDYVEYEEGLAGAIEKGMEISISYSFSLPGHILEAEKNSWKATAGVSDVSDAIIDGLPGFKFYVDFEGHSLNYYVIKDGYGFSIGFASPSISEERKYQKQIDEFLNSIHFK